MSFGAAHRWKIRPDGRAASSNGSAPTALEQIATNSGRLQQTGDLGPGLLKHRGERIDGSPDLRVAGLLDLFYGASDLEGADADLRTLHAVGGCRGHGRRAAPAPPQPHVRLPVAQR